ncbi:MAG: type II toxin-antitoxin system VapC family toxin [Spirochaetes bacterium]|nr:type II toxin-antitoxin system VapC family toxin [Spirochaetota bacterium]MBU0956290.1 type II toxin-antitoxin system VapC family toxin [Spirochaetota bacterium]
MSPVLVDTNVLSEIMRIRPDPQVQKWFGTLDSLYLSVITVEEIVSGLRRKAMYEKEAWFHRFCAEFARVLPVDYEMAVWTGEARGRLASRGIQVQQADAFIAATAWRHGLVLATRNIRDFEGYGVALLNPFQG